MRLGLQSRDRGAVALDRHENIEVRIINPFHRGRSRVGQMIGHLGTVTRRMHNKSFVVDNQVAILGGRNIGDEYFAADPALDFSDFDVMAIGEVVAETSAAFDLYWNHAHSYPVDALIAEPVADAEVQQIRDDWAEYVASQQDSVYLQALRSSRLPQEFRANRVVFVGGQGEVLFDHPDKLSESREREDLHLRKQIVPWISDLNQELIIVSPYFIPGDEGVRALVGLVDRGVRVRILTNGLSSTDVPIVYGAYARYRKVLLDGGVELYELNQPLPDSGQKVGFEFTGATKASLHAKTFVLDRKKVFIGSMNLDPRSLVENTEIGLMVDAPELSRGMAEGFDAEIDVKAFELTLQPDSQGKPALRWQDIVDGEMTTLSSSPYTTAWQRFLAKMMGWLPVESQL